MTETHSVIVDADTKRPLCVLLQATYGGDSQIVALFDSEDWVTFPPPRMARVTGTLAQWTLHARSLRTRRLPA